MRRILGTIAVAVLVLAAVGAILIYHRVTRLTWERVSDDVHVIHGLGGNVGVLRTEAGAVVVDTMTFRLQGERIRVLAQELGGGPVQAVLNTHYHADHTHGNPAFAPGTRVLATQRTRDHLLERDGDYWDGAAGELLPNELVDGVRELRVGGKTIRALHPGRGHTDGDLVVLFVEDRVLHAGDLLFERRYPRVDLDAGGTLAGWIETLDRVGGLEFDHVIPGHGDPTDRAGLLAFQRFLREVWEETLAAARAGRTLEETLAGSDISADDGYQPGGLPPIVSFDLDSVIESAWREALAHGGAARGPATADADGRG